MCSNGPSDAGKLPICASELREIFRNWDYFESRVTFYRDFRIVSPPCTETVATQEAIKAWAAYASHRAKKAQSSGAAMSQATAERLANSVTAYTEGKYTKAIEEYHRSRPSIFGKMNSLLNDAIAMEY